MRQRLFLFLLTLSLVPAACRKAPETGMPDPGEPRIVALSPALAVIARDAGLGDRIVGRHAWDLALDPSLPVVGTHDDPDLETLLRLRPTDLLIQETEARSPAALRRLAAEQGWTIRSFPLLTLDDVARACDEIAAAFGGPPGPDGPPGARLRRAWSDRGEPARAAGRVLLLAGVDPVGAMGPGSFHHQLIERMGAEPALRDGGPWQELDLEDVLRLAPDAILLFRPGAEPEPGPEGALAMLGGIAGLDVPAVRSGRVGVIRHPLGLLPASSLAEVADEVAQTLERWELGS